MSIVTLHFWAGARAAAGVEREAWPAESVGAAIEAARAARRDPGFDRVVGVCAFLVDGGSLHRDDLGRPLAGSVEVDVLPPFAGG